MGSWDRLDTEIDIRNRTTLVCQQCNKTLSLGDSRTNYIVNADTVRITVTCHGEEESYVLQPALFSEMLAKKTKTIKVGFFPVVTLNDAAMTDIASLIWEKRDA